MKLSQIEKLLGGKKKLGVHLKTPLDLIELCKKGISLTIVHDLSADTGIPVAQILEILRVPKFSRRKHLNREESEHLLQFVWLISRGIEVLEDKGNFVSWLNGPIIALSSKSPISLLDSRFGIELVLDVLGRIEHGVYS